MELSVDFVIILPDNQVHLRLYSQPKKKHQPLSTYGVDFKAVVACYQRYIKALVCHVSGYKGNKNALALSAELCNN
jgi:hypothetical protein